MFAQVGECPFNVRSGNLNGQSNSTGADAQRDGLLIARFARGLRGTQLVNGTGADAVAVETFLQHYRDRLDINGNGVIDETDAIVISRALLNYSLESATAVTSRTRGTRVEASAMTQFLEAGCRTVNVRVVGLALGGSLQISHGSNTITATLNDRYSLPLQQSLGAALDLRVVPQHSGQSCAASIDSDDTVNLRNRAVFVRCISTVTPSVVRPETLPNAPLAVSFPFRERASVAHTYESRLGVVGGIFPYEFRIDGFTIDGEPDSLVSRTLDFRTGTLRFRPRQAGTYRFTIEIRDSGVVQKTLTQSFDIFVGVNTRIYVSPTGQDQLDPPDRGSFGLPFKTPAFAIANSQPSDLIVLMRGTYLTGPLQFDDAHSKQMIAFPDHEVVLDFNERGRIGVATTSGAAARVEGIDFINVRQWGIVSDPSPVGLVVRNARFIYGTTDNPGENPGYIHAWGDNNTTTRHKFLLQDNDFSGFVGPAYATTWFDAGNSIVENNQVRFGAVNGGFNDKDNSQNNTYRENYVEFSVADRTRSGILVMAQANSSNIHIHHNLFINAGINLGVQCFQETCFMREHNIHHNTIVGEMIGMNWGPLNPTSSGTRIHYNILSSANRAPYGGFSCQGRIVNPAAKISIGSNLVESTNALAFKDNECTGNDITWNDWRSFGFDTIASGSTLSATTSLFGAGPLTGLQASDPRFGTRGHQR